MLRKSGIGINLFLALFFIYFIIPNNLRAEAKILSRFGGAWPVGIYVEGTTVYTLDHQKGDFQAWDISDLGNVREIGCYDQKEDTVWQAKPDIIKFEGYNGNQGGICQVWAMDVGNFEGKKLAFIRAFHQGIQVLDITNPAYMFNMGGRPEYDIEGTDKCIKIKGEYIFRAHWAGFQVLKYSPATALQKNGGPYEYISSASASGRDFARAIEISKDSNYLYLARDSGVSVYDISDKAKPYETHTYSNTRYPYKTFDNKGISIAIHDTLLLFGTSKDLRIFDISDPATPKPYRGTAGNEVMYPTLGAILDMAVYGNYIFLLYGPAEGAESLNETGLEIVDISNPQEPKFIDAIILGNLTLKFGPKNIVLVPEKKIAIIAADAFYVLDVSDYIKD